MFSDKSITVENDFNDFPLDMSDPKKIKVISFLCSISCSTERNFGMLSKANRCSKRDICQSFLIKHSKRELLVNAVKLVWSQEPKTAIMGFDRLFGRITPTVKVNQL